MSVPKIALVYDAIYPYSKGGAERRFYETGRRLVELGFDVHLYGMKYWDGPNVIKKDGLTLHGLCKARPLYTASGRRSIAQALIFGLSSFKLIGQKFDVIDCCGFPYFSLFACKLAALIRRKPLNVTWHEVWGRSYWKSYLGRLGVVGYAVERLAAKLPDHIIAVSTDTAKSLVSSLGYHGRLSVIPNGVNLQVIRQAKRGDTASDIIYTGRLVDFKNVDLLLEAVAIVKTTTPSVRCVIVGDGPERPTLEALAHQLDLDDNVTFTGFLPESTDVYRYMKASRVLVLPSAREGFGIVVIEANTAGLPVITTTQPANAAKDLIQDGVNGKLSEPTAAALAQHLSQVLASPASFDPTRDVDQYDWDTITRQIADSLRPQTIPSKPNPSVIMISPYPPLADGLVIYAEALVQTLESTGARVEIISTAPSQTPGVIGQFSLTHAWRIYRLLRAKRPDIIHVQYTIPAFGLAAPVLWLILFAAKLRTNSTLIVTMHEVRREVDLLKFVAKLYYRFLGLIVDHFIVHTRDAVRTMQSDLHIARPISHIPIPLFSPAPSPTPGRNAAQLKKDYRISGEKVILFFGFIHIDKGIQHLVDALHLLVSDPANTEKYKLIIAGKVRRRDGFFKYFERKDHQYESAIRAQIDRLGLGQLVEFTGYVPDAEVVTWMGVASVMAMPYTKMEQSGVLSVAINNNTPVVASDIGGLSEILSDGGALVAPGDSAGLARAIARVTANDYDRQATARHYAKLRQRLNPATIGRDTRTLYDTIRHQKGQN